MTVFEKVKELILKELDHVDEKKITMEANLENDLGADSIDAFEVIMALEEEYNITFEDNVAQNIKTVKDLVDYIEEKTK